MTETRVGVISTRFHALVVLYLVSTLLEMRIIKNPSAYSFVWVDLAENLDALCHVHNLPRAEIPFDTYFRFAASPVADADS